MVYPRDGIFMRANVHVMVAEEDWRGVLEDDVGTENRA